jgi:hypothetical protein
MAIPEWAELCREWCEGPQSLIVVPEQGARVLNHKKAEIEMQAAKCVANCGLLESKR